MPTLGQQPITNEKMKESKKNLVIKKNIKKNRKIDLERKKKMLIL